MWSYLAPAALLAASMANAQSSSSAAAPVASSSSGAAVVPTAPAVTGATSAAVVAPPPVDATAPTGNPYPAVTGAAQQAGVTAAGPNGATNPDKPGFYPVGAQVNQTSMSRLLSLNGVDDFCLYGPPVPGPDSLIGNTEPEVIAWCTKPRNNARLIPDGTIHSAHIIKTPAYVQIYGFWDGTQANIPQGDSGGELDPHGMTGLGNPIGGNVTTNLATGSDVFYEEWMSFVGFDQFCLRICTSGNDKITAGQMCEHQLDIMGCRFVMAIPDFYSSNGTFTYCEGEAAAPPGLYPLADGSYSTFRQLWTEPSGAFTIGNSITPAAPAFWPKTSNCVTYSSISNGVNFSNLMVTAAPTIYQTGGQTSVVTGLPTTTVANPTTPSTVPHPATATSSGAAGSSGKSDGKGDSSASASAKSAAGVATPIAVALAFGGVLAGAIAAF